MKAMNRTVKVGILLAAIVGCGCLGAYVYVASGGRTNILAEWGQKLSLVSPVYALGATTVPTFLEEEAGMSMYVNIGKPIDLSKAKAVYKIIEKETTDYVVGSLSLPGLPQTDDVHCFVHKDGWIVVYYLKGEPISKIIDWNYY